MDECGHGEGQKAKIWTLAESQILEEGGWKSQESVKRSRKDALVRAAKSWRLREETTAGKGVWSTRSRKMRMETTPLAEKDQLLRGQVQKSEAESRV